MSPALTHPGTTLVSPSGPEVEPTPVRRAGGAIIIRKACHGVNTPDGLDTTIRACVFELSSSGLSTNAKY